LFLDPSACAHFWYIASMGARALKLVHICRGLGLHFIMIKREDDIYS